MSYTDATNLECRVMKLKCQPDDFRVQELTSFDCSGGPFAVYRLSKRSIGTPEASVKIGARWMPAGKSQIPEKVKRWR